jgi:hypothetical protein
MNSSTLCALASLRETINLFQGYRQTLISAAVTGKLDVTKAQQKNSRQAAKPPRRDNL